MLTETLYELRLPETGKLAASGTQDVHRQDRHRRACCWKTCKSGRLSTYEQLQRLLLDEHDAA